MGKNVEIYQLTPDKNVLMQCQVIKTKNDKIIVAQTNISRKSKNLNMINKVVIFINWKKNIVFWSEYNNETPPKKMAYNNK